MGGKPRIWKIGRYTFQREYAPNRRWSCEVQYGLAGPLGAGGMRSPLTVFLACRRFERECVIARTAA
jgi:hypothetical protein